MKKLKQRFKKIDIKRILLRIGKVLFIVLASLILLWIIVWFFYGRERIAEPEDITWGVTYSALAAEELRLDPEETYRAIVEDLQPQRLRLVAYWNRIEQQPGVYDYSELEQQIALAEENDIEYIVAVGQRVPRYPECHIPEWALSQDTELRQHNVRKFIEETISHFDHQENLVGWQIENEPFFAAFGECPEPDEDFLRSEISLARSLTDKTIITTESGELSLWFEASEYPDVLGTTLYRKVLLSGTELAVTHIFPPSYYRARSNIMTQFRSGLDRVIVAELQGEPWASKPLVEADEQQLETTMNPDQFETNIAFTESIGFPEAYFWGAEWWYYRLQQGDDYYWNRAQELFR